MVGLLHIFGNIGRISFFKKNLKLKFLLNFGIPSVLFSLIGALLVGAISQELLKGILGIFLVVYSLLSLVSRNFKLKPSFFNKILGGSLSGFLAGLIGTGGALRGAFLTAFRLPKEQYIATSAVIALAVDATRIPVYFAQGFLASEFYFAVPILFVTALAGSYTGKQIVKRTPQKQFTKLVLIAIFLIGAYFFIQNLNFFRLI